MKNVKLKVEEDVFAELDFPKILDDEKYMQIYNSLSSECELVEITNFPDTTIGWEFKDGVFINPNEDIIPTFFEQTGHYKDIEKEYYAFLLNNIIVTFVSFKNDDARSAMYRAASLTGVTFDVTEIS
jgi:hypothetical protein